MLTETPCRLIRHAFARTDTSGVGVVAAISRYASESRDRVALAMPVYALVSDRVALAVPVHHMGSPFKTDLM